VVLVSSLVFLYVVWLGVRAAVRTGQRMIDTRERRGELAQQWLEEHLDGSTNIPVAATRHYGEGEDIWLELHGGETLRLRCYWPRPVAIGQLISARYRSSIGWIIRAEAPNGDPVHLYPWSVTIYPAEPPTSLHDK
jgi:hypothetical protein